MEKYCGFFTIDYKSKHKYYGVVECMNCGATVMQPDASSIDLKYANKNIPCCDNPRYYHAYLHSGESVVAMLDHPVSSHKLTYGKIIYYIAVCKNCRSSVAIHSSRVGTGADNNSLLYADHNIPCCDKPDFHYYWVEEES